MPCLSQASNGVGSNSINACPVTPKALANGPAVAAQDIVMPVAAMPYQSIIEGPPALEPGERRHEVPSHKTNQPFHLAFVEPLTMV